MSQDDVKIWEEDILIPTYATGSPEKNPMFLEKRIYQGSSGVVYPHAVIEKISDEKEDKLYKAVFLENKYLKIMILPQLGGRIHMAYDKIKQRHFIYYNQVIKPALVGLTGPWISGGIEFNWPQHHRPSTFEPIDYKINENEDGSKTVWVNEVERMFRTKGMAAFTLYPGKAYIEIQGKLYNRTPFPQTFLWWANPAVKVNDHYQSIFPPDVYAVFDHGKRDVSAFPISKTVYYKVDYSPGTDISRYKNIPVPTSYMAIKSKFNFIGGYEHDTGGGLLHVANHHISPGKKQWTWGNGEFGQAWDRNLTDEDGPYIELMTGVYTDNQPDFSWLQPYEEKTFSQYFMPYRDVGEVKNASKDAVLNLEIIGNKIIVKLYVTAHYPSLKVELKKDDVILFNTLIDSSPENPYLATIELDTFIKLEEVKVIITNSTDNKQLLSYQHVEQQDHEIPPPAMAAKPPKDVENNEQLYLTGLHLEQYRHATYKPTDYYLEALQRDSKDVRCNNAMGLWYLRKGKFAVSESYFKNAISTLTQRNPNPYNGEPFYNLAWALKMQGKYDEAFDAFYKSIWNDAYQHAGYLELARLACKKDDFEQALELINKSLIKNYHSHTARHLKTAILRTQKNEKPAAQFLEESLTIDPFNFGCLFEKYLLLQNNDMSQAKDVLVQLTNLSRGWEHNFIEYCLDYTHAGFYKEAGSLLDVYLNNTKKVYPLIKYYMGWIAAQNKQAEISLGYFQAAASLNPDFVFPNRIEDILVLQTAIRMNPSDYKAHYYLGNLWYDKRQYTEAIECWENSVIQYDEFATVHRNLSLAYFNKLNNNEKAVKALQKAFFLDTSDARVLMELDQLYKRLQKPHTDRLNFLEEYLPLVESRDDLYLERITLYNLTGDHAKAKDLISHYKFHPWEGGEGKVVGQYLICQIELAKQSIKNNELQKALELIEAAENYPLNLGEGKLTGVQENDIFYWKAVVYELMNKDEESNKYFKMASTGINEPVQAIFYNDPQPDKIFYQGMALLKLNEKEKAFRIFQKLIDFGEQHIQDKISIDYFAVSLPDLLVFDADLDLRNKIHCLYLIGLGYLGLGNEFFTKAIDKFDELLTLDINHQGALAHKSLIADFLIVQD